MVSEFNLNEEDIERLRANIDDLEIQSMMFDMDIDYETASLTKKNKYETPRWLKRWLDLRDNSDNDPASPEQAGW